MAYLTVNQFLAYSGYSSTDISNMGMSSYLPWILDKFSNILEDEIGTLFTTLPATNLQYLGSNTYYVSIGAWQEDGLIVKKGSYLNYASPQTTLTLYTDYLLGRYKGQVKPGVSVPVVGISLINQKVHDNEFLNISGVYGWSAGLPDDLLVSVFAAAKIALEFNYNTTKTKGAGVKGSVRSVTLEINYSMPDYYLKEAAKLAQGDLLSNYSVKKLLDKYKQYTSINQPRIS